GDIDESIFTGHGHGRFAAHLGEGEESRASAAAEDQAENVLHGPPRSMSQDLSNTSRAAAAAASLLYATICPARLEGGPSIMPDLVVIATWPFGQPAVKTAAALLQADKPALDAALAGAQAVEDDPKVHSVGFGGLGNAIGTVQLDACVMDGR